MRHAPATHILLHFFRVQLIGLLLMAAWSVVMEKDAMTMPTAPLAERLESHLSGNSILAETPAVLAAAPERLAPKEKRHTALCCLILAVCVSCLVSPLAHQGVLCGVLRALLPAWRGLVAFPLPPPLPA